MITSYPKIFHPGHRFIANLLSGPVVIEEKVDGSQFSMMRRLDNEELECRSKGVMIDLDDPGMFKAAIETARTLDLTPGRIYRGEYLSRPKHNTLKYDRIPFGHIILFDVQFADGEYMTPSGKAEEAKRLNLECVPCLHQGTVADIGDIRALLGRQSILGGCAIEGVVVKNYNAFTPEHDICLMKVVDEAFQEKHRGDWRQRNPNKGDIIQQLREKYCHEGRWKKAVQHLRDNGTLKNEPCDIGPLMKEIQTDLLAECTDEIKDALFKAFWKDIAGGACRGLPEWYKAQLEDES